MNKYISHALFLALIAHVIIYPCQLDLTNKIGLKSKLDNKIIALRTQIRITASQINNLDAKKNELILSHGSYEDINTKLETITTKTKELKDTRKRQHDLLKTYKKNSRSLHDRLASTTTTNFAKVYAGNNQLFILAEPSENIFKFIENPPKIQRNITKTNFGKDGIIPHPCAIPNMLKQSGSLW